PELSVRAGQQDAHGSADAAALDQSGEVLAVAARAQGFGQCQQLVVVDPAVLPGDLLRAADAQALALFDGFDEGGGLQQGAGGAGVQPGRATAKQLHVQGAVGQVGQVEVGDLQLAAGRRLERGGAVRG